LEGTVRECVPERAPLTKLKGQGFAAEIRNQVHIRTSGLARRRRYLRRVLADGVLPTDIRACAIGVKLVITNTFYGVYPEDDDPARCRYLSTTFMHGRQSQAICRPGLFNSRLQFDLVHGYIERFGQLSAGLLDCNTQGLLRPGRWYEWILPGFRNVLVLWRTSG
jgi:hypothetical protein